VEKHSFSLIINEQNQIEDRLVNDPDNRYLSELGAVIGPQRIIELIGSLGQTKLLFPISKSLNEANPDQLLIYNVDDFVTLGSRIDTGRNLFVGLFKYSDQRRNLVEFWARSNWLHLGTRTDYNPVDYSTDFSSLWPGGQTFSPPVIQMPHSAIYGWPQLPGKTKKYGHLHQEPIPLPVSVMKRSDADVNSWLSTPTAPNSLVLTPLSDQSEIFL
jgi:hypothetical protein